MSLSTEHWEQEDVFAADAALSERVSFIQKTYLHVFGAHRPLRRNAVGLRLHPEISTPIARLFFGGGWWAILLGFMAISWVAQSMARSQTNVGLQYCGLGLYAIAEAVFFTPLMMYVTMMRMAARS